MFIFLGLGAAIVAQDSGFFWLGLAAEFLVPIAFQLVCVVLAAIASLLK